MGWSHCYHRGAVEDGLQIQALCWERSSHSTCSLRSPSDGSLATGTPTPRAGTNQKRPAQIYSRTTSDHATTVSLEDLRRTEGHHSKFSTHSTPSHHHRLRCSGPHSGLVAWDSDHGIGSWECLCATSTGLGNIQSFLGEGMESGTSQKLIQQSLGYLQDWIQPRTSSQHTPHWCQRSRAGDGTHQSAANCSAGTETTTAIQNNHRTQARGVFLLPGQGWWQACPRLAGRGD